MSKTGRKSKYETHIVPFLDKIDKWLSGGASEEQCSKNLGISYSSFINYKRQFQELRDVCSKPRAALVDNLKSALIKKALGFEYVEKKTYIKRDSDGKEYKYTEITTKQSLPDVAAINLALKNYDKDNWSNDWQNYDLKKQELELRKMIADKDNF